MLIVFTAAAIVISFFMHWDDFAAGFNDGFNAVPRPAASHRSGH